MEPCKTVCEPVDRKLDGIYIELKKKPSVWVLLILVTMFMGVIGYIFTSRADLTATMVNMQKSASEISTAVQVQSKQYDYLGKELSKLGTDFEKRKEAVDKEIREIRRNSRNP